MVSSGEPWLLPPTRDFRQLPADQEGGPVRELRVLQQQVQLPAGMVGSTTTGTILHPSDLPAAPPGRFVSPEELQYLEDEAAAIMEELEAKDNMSLENGARDQARDLRQVLAGGEGGPERVMRVLQEPVQLRVLQDHSPDLLSLPWGSVLHPSDLPPTPPGRFVSPEELQYLEDEATDIVEELEARKMEKEKVELLEQQKTPNKENVRTAEMEGGQQTVEKRTRNQFRFRIVPNLQFWDRKGKRGSSPNFVPMMG